MATAGQRRVVRLTTGWLLAAVVLLAATGLLSLEHWFLAAFLGFLVVVQLTAPVFVLPAWRTRLRVPMVLGLIVFLGLAAFEGSDTVARLLAELAASAA